MTGLQRQGTAITVNRCGRLPKSLQRDPLVEVRRRQTGIKNDGLLGFLQGTGIIAFGIKDCREIGKSHGVIRMARDQRLQFGLGPGEITDLVQGFAATDGRCPMIQITLEGGSEPLGGVPVALDFMQQHSGIEGRFRITRGQRMRRCVCLQGGFGIAASGQNIAEVHVNFRIPGGATCRFAKQLPRLFGVARLIRGDPGQIEHARFADAPGQQLQRLGPGIPGTSLRQRLADPAQLQLCFAIQTFCHSSSIPIALHSDFTQHLASPHVRLYSDAMNLPAMPKALASALALHQAGRLDDAEAGYLAVLAGNSSNTDALHLLSVLYLQRGLAEQALPIIERVLELAPDAADAHGNKGSALQALERFDEAILAFRIAIQYAPETAHHHYNLGNSLRAAGDKTAAVLAYHNAIRWAPDLVQAHSNLATTLSELGLFDEAAAHCKLAIRYRPGFADAHYNLGNAYRESGRFDDAAKSYRDAITHKADHADAFCNLGLTEMIAPGLNAAIRTLSKAMKASPDQHMARFYHAVASEMIGAETDSLFKALPNDDATVDAWLDSWTYVKSHSTLKTEIIHDPFRLLAFALEAATLPGLVLEFGVRRGLSIRHIAAGAGQPVHGFDSFEGLPSAWGSEPEGVYSTDGALPEVPENVTLHKGLFKETLQPFLEKHPGDIRFCNIDCDIYGSTVTVLDAIAPRIRPGSVLVFDEYLINPTWREDEHLAFQQVVKKYRWKYRYLAFGIVTKQACVMIEAV